MSVTGGERLQRAGRRVAAVRVLGGQHLAAVEVGDDPARGGQPLRQVGAVVVDDHARAAQAVAADRPVGVGAGCGGSGACDQAHEDSGEQAGAHVPDATAATSSRG
jgi:hypothetical protein